MACQAQVWSVNALATEFKIDRRTVAKRIEGIPHVKEDGRSKFWLIADVAAALLVQDRPSGGMQELEGKKLAAEADIAEMKAAQMRAELVSVSEVGIQIDRAVAAVRARAQGWPSKYAPIVRPDDPTAARAILDAAVLELLDEFRTSLDDDAAELREAA